MVQVGKEILVTYKLVDVRTGDVESSDRASISSVEEFDVSFERIANSVANREPFQATGGVGKMIEQEAKRQAALTSVFLTTGYAFPIVQDLPEDPGTMLFTLNSAVSYETPDVLAQGVMGLRTGKNDYRHIYFELLAHKMFSKFDVSPYVGGGLSVGRQWIGGEKTSGLGVVASAGVVLFRTQYFRIIAGGKGTAIFTEDYGMNLMGEVNFGFASPTIGKGGGIDVPSPCAFGCLAAYFISGLAIALTM
jgi:hypothetical protein